MRIAIVILSMFYLSRVALAGSLQDAVESGRAKSSQYNQILERLPEDILTGASQSAEAQKSADMVNSEGFREQVRVQKDRLQREVFGIAEQVPISADVQKQIAHAVPRLAGDERVYLFISSSIPESTLRAYARDMDRLRDPNISMVMRGFIGGIQDASASMEFLMRIRKRDPGCSGLNCDTFGITIDFDPNLYRRFKPTSVPALVFVRGVKPIDPDVSEGSPENVPVPGVSSWKMIYGDASLGYLFDQVSTAAGSNSLAALARYLGH